MLYENHLAVVGPKQVIEQFLEFAAGEDPFDFDRFIPYPEEFKRRAELIDFLGYEPDDDVSDLNWCAENWGAWEAYRVEVQGPVPACDGKTARVVFLIVTLYGPPLPVIRKAAELYSALRFEFRYFRCGSLFHGLIYCSGGKVEFEQSGPYF